MSFKNFPALFLSLFFFLITSISIAQADTTFDSYLEKSTIKVKIDCTVTQIDGLLVDMICDQNRIKDLDVNDKGTFFGASMNIDCKVKNINSNNVRMQCNQNNIEELNIDDRGVFKVVVADTIEGC